MNIVGEPVSTSYSVQCSHCDFIGTLTTDSINVSKLNVGGMINFSGVKCPQCENESVFAPSGCYVRNENGHMERVGDVELSS